MKKTNVMIEVSDDLYNDIVEPYKKRRRFGRLIVELLEAYRTNDVIYSYINGTIDGLDSDATDMLLKDLDSMQDSLSMLGALQNQAEVVIDEGNKAFNSFLNTGKEDVDLNFINNDDKKVKDENTLTKEDVINIVNDSMSDIKSMLESILAKGVSVDNSSNNDTKVANNEKSTPSQERGTSQDDGLVEYNHNSSISKEDETAAQSALSSLCGSISF